ncbi:MAG: hypothetical protein WC792_01320 [Candidatus Micrarchaeia archaeon]|jgi:hypothetical protein
MLALGFWDDFGLVVLILLFFLLYNLFSNGLVQSPFLALIITAIVVWVVVLPYEWFMYLLFVVLFLGSAFSRIKPSEW